MVQVNRFRFLGYRLPNILVIAIRARRVIGDEFILLRGIQREIHLLFGVLLGGEANPSNIFLERKKKNTSQINDKQ
jgi:hypothetical protein